MVAQKRRRKRGVILTQSGLERLQTAKTNTEYTQNQGQRYTLEGLSELTGIGLDTLSKVLKRETRVDKQTLKCCFQAFGTELTPADYYRPEDAANNGAVSPLSFAAQGLSSFSPPPPGGQLQLETPIYIQRTKAEADGFTAIDQPGALIRLRGARQTGKTSLMARIAHQAEKRQYKPVYISFQLADKPVLQDLDQLLRWFCVSVGLGMDVLPKLETYWEPLFGSKVSCKLYFEQYLLTMSDRPLVLILDDVGRLFRYGEVADEFFGLLRTWYEDAKTNDIWKRVRIVLSQSAESHIPLNINKSPFNVGLAVSLPPFTPENVQTLANVYQMDWSLSAAAELCHLLSGQPYLTHLAIDQIWREEATLSEVLTDPLGCRIFSTYLQHQRYQVQQQPQIYTVLLQVLENNFSKQSSLSKMYQLQSMGLIVLDDNKPKLACKLFQHYFSQTFSQTL